jgi:hypothetical protein
MFGRLAHQRPPHTHPAEAIEDIATRSGLGSAANPQTHFYGTPPQRLPANIQARAPVAAKLRNRYMFATWLLGR